MLDFNGAFFLQLSGTGANTKFELYAAVRTELKIPTNPATTLFLLKGTLTLLIDREGIAGYASLNYYGSNGLPPGFTLTADFQLELNTSVNSRQVQIYTFSETSGSRSLQVSTVTLPGLYLRFSAGGTLAFGVTGIYAGAATLTGRFTFTINGTAGFVQIDVSVQAAVLGQTLGSAIGSLRIGVANNTPYIAFFLQIQVGANASTGPPGGGSEISGTGFQIQFRLAFFINTSSSDITMQGILLKATELKIQASGFIQLSIEGVAGIRIEGEIGVVVNGTGFNVTASGQLTIKLGNTIVFRAKAIGALAVEKINGVFALSAVVSITLDADAMTSGNGFSFNATFTLQINTSNQERTIGGVTLEAGIYARIYASGSLILGAGSDTGFVLDGSFYLSVGTISPGNIGLVVAATANLKLRVGGVDIITLTANGFLAIGTQGIAAKINLSSSITLPGVSFSVTARLLLNTSGSAVTVKTGPTTTDTVEAGPLLEVSLSGSLTLINTVTLQGSFKIRIGPEGLAIEVFASAEITPLGTLAAGGSLYIYSGANAGLAGSVTLVASANIVFAGVSFQGQFQFAINTTSISRTVKVLNVNKSTGAVSGLIDQTLTSSTLILSFGGSLTIGSFSIKGSATLTLSPNLIRLEFDASLSLSIFGTVVVRGGAEIGFGLGETYFAMALKLGVNAINLDIVEVSGEFTLKLNTGSQARTFGTGADALTVEGNTFQIKIAATVRLWVFTLRGEVTLTYTNGYFEIAFNLPLNFFNVVTVNISGYMRSNGQWSFTGTASFQFDFGPLYFRAGIGLTLSNTGFSGYAYGAIGMSFSIDFGLFSIDFDFELASFYVGFEFNLEEGSITINARVSVLGFFTVSASTKWTFGSPPILGTQIGDVLYLNVGVEAGRRVYGTTTDSAETMTVTGGAMSGGRQSVTLSGFGTKKTYTGISKVVVTNSANGNDRFAFYALNVPIDVNLGDGDDNIEVIGAGSTVIRGGNGNDTITTSTGADYIEGGSGNDTINSEFSPDTSQVNVTPSANPPAGNADTILGGDGDDVITGSPFNDTITGGNGNDNLTGSGGDDTYIFAGGWGSDTVAEAGTNNADTLDFGSVGTALTFNLGATNNRITSGTNSVTESNFRIERFIGGTAGDTYNVTRSSAANTTTLIGRAGTDTYNVTLGSLAQTVIIDDSSTAADNDYLFVTSTSAADLTVNDTSLVQGTQRIEYAAAYDNVDRLRIEATPAKVIFGPAATEVLDLKRDLRVNAREITWSGRLHAGSFTFTSVNGYTIGNDLVARDNGFISLVTTSGNILVNAGLYSAAITDLTDTTLNGTGNGDITLSTGNGAITTNGAGWVTTDAVKLDWALRNAKYTSGTVNATTGHITTFGATSSEAVLYFVDTTTIRNARGAFIQSNGGKLTLNATVRAGEPTTGYSVSPYALFTDVASFTATVPPGRDVYIVDIDDLINVSTSSGGNVVVVSLLGNQTTNQSINTNNQVILTSDQLNLSTPVTTTNSIYVAPTNPLRFLYLIQTETGGLTGLILSQAEINNLITTSTLYFGSGNILTPIIIGNGSNVVVNFNNPTTVLRADFVRITSPLRANHLIIYGDGTTVHLGASLTVLSAYIDDSIEVTGTQTALSEGDFTLTRTINGDASGTPSDLSLAIGGALDLQGAVGSVANNGLRNLSVSGGGDVNFGSTVTLSGNLNLTAAGAVVFQGDVNVAGDLIIDAATQLTFLGSVTVGGQIRIRNAGTTTFASNVTASALDVRSAGNLALSGTANRADSALLVSTLSNGLLTVASLAVGSGGASLVANQIDLLGPVTSTTAAATLNLRAFDSTRAIAVGASVVGAPATALRLSATDLAAIGSGFASVLIGDSTSGTGAVLVGRLGLLAGEASFVNPTTVTGGSVTITRNVDFDTRATSVTFVARTGQITVNGFVNQDAVSARFELRAATHIVVNRGLYASDSVRLLAGTSGAGSVILNFIAATTGSIVASRVELTAGASAGDLVLNDGASAVTVAAESALVLQASAGTVRQTGGIVVTGTLAVSTATPATVVALVSRVETAPAAPLVPEPASPALTTPVTTTAPVFAPVVVTVSATSLQADSLISSLTVQTAPVDAPASFTFIATASAITAASSLTVAAPARTFFPAPLGTSLQFAVSFASTFAPSAFHHVFSPFDFSTPTASQTLRSGSRSASLFATSTPVDAFTDSLFERDLVLTFTGPADEYESGSTDADEIL